MCRPTARAARRVLWTRDASRDSSKHLLDGGAQPAIPPGLGTTASYAAEAKTPLGVAEGDTHCLRYPLLCSVRSSSSSGGWGPMRTSEGSRTRVQIYRRLTARVSTARPRCGPSAKRATRIAYRDSSKHLLDSSEAARPSSALSDHSAGDRGRGATGSSDDDASSVRGASDTSTFPRIACPVMRTKLRDL